MRAYDHLDLIYVDRDGIDVLPNAKEVLDALQAHKDLPRDVPDGLDNGDPDDLQLWKLALVNWLRRQAEDEVEGETVAGSGTMDLIRKLQGGTPMKDIRLKAGERYEERFAADKYDLVLWFAVTPDANVILKPGEEA